MLVQLLNTVYYGTEHFVKRNMSTILSVVGSAGVIGTSIAVHKATIKATEKLEDASFESEEELDKVDILKIVVPIYTPSVIIAGSTIACIIGANVLNKQTQAALMSAYIFADQSLKEYRKNLIKLHGEEVDKEIRDDITGQYYNIHRVNVEEPDGKLTYYEPYSKQIICRYEKEIVDAEYHVNRNFALRGHVTLNEWLAFLAIDPVPYGNELVWTAMEGYDWIDFEHCAIREPNGETYYRFDYPFEPVLDELPFI